MLGSEPSPGLSNPICFQNLCTRFPDQEVKLNMNLNCGHREDTTGEDLSSNRALVPRQSLSKLLSTKASMPSTRSGNLSRTHPYEQLYPGQLST